MSAGALRLSPQSDRGLERRHRRRWVRRLLGCPAARTDPAEAVRAADSGQRRQLHALHAVFARGGRRDAGAPPRRDAAARHPQAHQPAPRSGHRARPGGADRRATGPGGRHRDDPLRPVHRGAGLGLALPADPGARPTRDRVQEPRRCDLAAQPRDRDARAGERRRGRARAARSCSPTSSSAAATPGSRRSPSFRTSPPTPWTVTRAPACTGCGGS